MSEPYPPFWWYISNGKLKHDDLPEPLTSFMDEPYPSFWWYISNGRLTHTGLPAPIGAGAFFGCSNLKKVHIPESVKSIGAYAFAGTALTSVKIAGDCTYSSTSFPDGCTISFYPEE
ncbi:MAG: leucine-rich repeat protein [Ruminococcus sp.]|nr:leucine-rich repeat protein [Ruminococcus sp.]